MVLGIDPGTRKAGYALVEADGRPLLAGIEELPSLERRLRELCTSHHIGVAALGTGTNAEAVRRILKVVGVPVRLVDERETTLRARALYFADHPRRGWRRLVPIGMQLPPRPIDDYAAVLIARRYLADEGNRRNVVN
ncbi:MAG: pre-16S rRNA-processing nuclease YqgF [Candidatus Eremiobacteraeota bacterium]|nr:pre-16S rRNA-processing nuclease YqgF [Candidatus Eremiobacteraeota bacterium]